MVFLDFLLLVSETVIGVVTNCFNFFSFLDEMFMPTMKDCLNQEQSLMIIHYFHI